ncbi:MAG: galactose mutarotase [Chitinophagaceae bacterium]|nr:galactose mutarotase [Chitinophagaceae bacterium]
MHTSGNISSTSIHVKEWDTSGIYLFELFNANGMSLTVCNYGAAVVSCTTPDRDGKYDDVVCGYDSQQQYMEDKFYMGTVVGRYANRIRDAKVTIAGNEFQLTATPRGFHHHGGGQGFNKKLFTPEIFESHNKRGVKLSYMSADGEEGFPGNLALTVWYTLDDDNGWSVDYEATTDRPTILNVTQHSYFNLGGHNSGPVEDQYVMIPADKYLVVDENAIPTGEIKDVAGNAFDLRKSVRLGERIGAAEFSGGGGYDNSWVLETVSGDQLKHAAEAIDKVSGRVLNVYTTEPSVHFYTGNFIVEGTQGKKGAIYGRRSGFCLETQHFPDSPHHPAFPSTVLLPGRKFASQTIFRFSILTGRL